MNDDEKYMREALYEAEKAFAIGEVPIGAVLVMDDRIIARAHNMRESWHDATAHAEMIAIKEACKVLGRWRLAGATLYVTIEPCPMCAGGLVMSRVDRVVYGSADSKAGAVESMFNVVAHQGMNHQLTVREGVLGDECRELMKAFFQKRREEKKMAKEKALVGSKDAD